MLVPGTFLGALCVHASPRIQEDISEASCIFGVKQVPIDCLIQDKTFCFFSHTIKAQSDNMDLLDAMLEKNVRCKINHFFVVNQNEGVSTMRNWKMPLARGLWPLVSFSCPSKLASHELIEYGS